MFNRKDCIAKLRRVFTVKIKAQEPEDLLGRLCPEIALLEEIVQLQRHQLAHIARVEQIQSGLQELSG
jgi:hypothetical protein